MGRVVNPNSTGRERSRSMRTAAELLRHLSQKAELDDDAKDMAAHLVFCLRDVEDGIEQSAEAWEKRDYWVKAEKLRQKWSWAGSAAARLEAAIRRNAWDTLPGVMVSLVDHFAEIKITKLTRGASEWEGSHRRLLDEVR